MKIQFGKNLYTIQKGKAMDIISVVTVMAIMGLPASALLGIGIWAFRRDSRAPVQAVAILLIAIGVVLWIFTLTALLMMGARMEDTEVIIRGVG